MKRTGVDTTSASVYHRGVEKPELICPNCHTKIPVKAAKSFCGKLSVWQRKHDKGPEKVMRPCPFCEKDFGARELRKHKPRCPRKPVRSAK